MSLLKLLRSGNRSKKLINRDTPDHSAGYNRNGSGGKQMTHSGKRRKVSGYDHFKTCKVKKGMDS